MTQQTNDQRDTRRKRQLDDSAVVFLVVLLPLFIVGLTNAHGVWLYAAMAAMIAYIVAMIALVAVLAKRRRGR